MDRNYDGILSKEELVEKVTLFVVAGSIKFEPYPHLVYGERLCTFTIEHLKHRSEVILADYLSQVDSGRLELIK